MVTIDGVKYNYVLDVAFGYGDHVALPEWINLDEELDSNVWNKHVQSISYTLRLNDMERWRIEKLFRNHKKIVLYDDIIRQFFLIFITSISVNYENYKNIEYPWVTEISVVTCAKYLFFYGFEIIDENTKFEDGFERIVFES